MTRIRQSFTARLRGFGRDQSGSAAVQFALALPLVFGAFLLSMDTGIATMRSAVLDRAMDLTARSIRNGTLANPTVETIRTDLCSRMAFFPDCPTKLKVQLTATTAAGFSMPAVPAACADQVSAFTPVRRYAGGQQNGVTVLRACMEINSLTTAALMPGRPGTAVLDAATLIASVP